MRIFSYLPSITARACSSGVCRRWRSSAVQLQQEQHGAPLLPWLLRPSAAGGSYFHVFGETTTEAPAVPHHARGARFCGSFPGG
ncbi:hypothetical protein BAE44_0001766 [Dichanthelium oligosanthes]|uniref:F-box domain-containing protein n=1 Tax=Dichanthelium oligosanthes TaxID=888268 RepID=A0A1E5WIJ2_9POAL|nr:hypothetical protein BAE44_0001766 [Dichanthelium oligosanthes]